MPIGESAEGGRDNDEAEEVAKVSTAVGSSTEAELVILLEEEDTVERDGAAAHENPGAQRHSEDLPEGGIGRGSDSGCDNLGKAEYGPQLHEGWILEEVLLPTANVRTTSVVGERGGESGSRHVVDEGRRDEPTCHSPGDALSTYVVQLGTSEVEEGRQNVDVGGEGVEEPVEAAKSACEEQVQAAARATDDV